MAEAGAHAGSLTSVVDDGDGLARVDAIAALLVDRARPASYRIASSPGEVEVAQGLRARAMVEHGWARPGDITDGREQDADDARAVHILAMLTDEPIGTCRLIYPEESRLLPMERTPGATRLPREAVELGRMVVLRPVAREQRAVLAGLIGAAWLELRAHGHRRIGGRVSAPMLRLLRRLGFVVQVVGPSVKTFGEERFAILFEPNFEAAAVAAARHSGSASTIAGS